MSTGSRTRVIAEFQFQNGSSRQQDPCEGTHAEKPSVPLASYKDAERGKRLNLIFIEQKEGCNSSCIGNKDTSFFFFPPYLFFLILFFIFVSQVTYGNSLNVLNCCKCRSMYVYVYQFRICEPQKTAAEQSTSGVHE